MSVQVFRFCSKSASPKNSLLTVCPYCNDRGCSAWCQSSRLESETKSLDPRFGVLLVVFTGVWPRSLRRGDLESSPISIYSFFQNNQPTNITVVHTQKKGDHQTVSGHTGRHDGDFRGWERVKLNHPSLSPFFSLSTRPTGSSLLIETM